MTTDESACTASTHWQPRPVVFKGRRGRHQYQSVTVGCAAAARRHGLHAPVSHIVTLHFLHAARGGTVTRRGTVSKGRHWQQHFQCSLQVSSLRTLKPLSQRNTVRLARVCPGVHVSAPGRSPPAWHRDSSLASHGARASHGGPGTMTGAAWLPPSRARPRLGGSNNPK